MQTTQLLDAAAPSAAALSTGLLIARIVFGLTWSAHGAQKLFGWFGGYGLKATGEFFVQLGFRPMHATIAAATEVIGGLLIAFGFLGPIGPALLLSVMIVAALSVHWSNGFFAMSNGIELPLLYAAVALVLAFTGPGLFSLDTLLGIEWLSAPGIAAAALGAGILGAALNLAARRRAPSSMRAT